MNYLVRVTNENKDEVDKFLKKHRPHFHRFEPVVRLRIEDNKLVDIGDSVEEFYSHSCLPNKYVTIEEIKQILERKEKEKQFVVINANKHVAKMIVDLLKIGSAYLPVIEKSEAISIRKGFVEHCRTAWYRENGWKEITLDELVKQYSEPSQIEVKLNDEYKAIITKDKIVVGCQEFTIDMIDKLVEAKNQILKA